MRVAILLILPLLAGCIGLDDEGAREEVPTVTPAPDVDEGRDVDLAQQGLDETFTFRFGEGARGFVNVAFESTTQAGLVDPSVCVTWTRVQTFPGGHSTTNGNSGDCNSGGNLQVGPQLNHLGDDRLSVLHWDGDDLRTGDYTLHVTAPAQLQRLVVGIHIDNVPLAADGVEPGT